MNGAYPVKQRPGWFMTLLTYLFIFILGAVIGSFLNVCIYRIPKQESIAAPASHCPQCSTPIKFYDNIPILSFLLLRGRCKSCNSPISIQYLLVEVINACGYLLISWKFGLSIESFVYAMFFSALLVISVIDLHHKIIPNVITLPGIVVGILYGSSTFPGGTYESVIGTLLGGGLLFIVAVGYKLISGIDGMGFGDVKLIAMIGAFLSEPMVILFTIFLSSFIGSIVGIFMMIFMGKGRKDMIPFGPFLSISGIITLFFKKEILEWIEWFIITRSHIP